MTDHTSAAHEYLRAEADLKALGEFLETVRADGDFGLRVEWGRASLCTGYKEMQLRVQRLLAPRMRDLMYEAYAQATTARDTALTQLHEGLNRGS